MNTLSSNRNPKHILLGGIVFLAIIISGFLYMDKPAYTYKMSKEEVLDMVTQHKYVLTPDDAFEKAGGEKSNYLFVDLRTPYEFAKGHIPGAVNIPYQNIFSDEYKQVLFSNDKHKILYHKKQEGACGPWMLLHQVGAEQNYILLGGYDFYRMKYVEKNDSTADFRNETAKYDFEKLINTDGTTPMTTKQPVIKPMKRRKKKGVEGGC